MDDRERLEGLVKRRDGAIERNLRLSAHILKQGLADALARADELEALPVVAGRMVTGTLADLTRRAQRFLADEQDKPMPDNALIGVLCDTVRLVREHVDAQRCPPLEARAEKAEAEAKNTRTLYDALLDERARSFAMLATVVGKVGCTEYQAEVDLEIASRIEAIKADAARLRRDVHRFEHACVNACCEAGCTDAVDAILKAALRGTDSNGEPPADTGG